MTRADLFKTPALTETCLMHFCLFDSVNKPLKSFNQFAAPKALSFQNKI